MWDYRKQVGVSDENAFEMMKLKMEEGVINNILGRGNDFPFIEIDRIKALMRMDALREETITYLNETEGDKCECGHDFESHTTPDGGQSEHCEFCNCKEFREE